MNEKWEPTSLEQAEELAREVASMADHLQRIGVEWLPPPDPQAVGYWQDKLRPLIGAEEIDAKETGTKSDEPAARKPTASSERPTQGSAAPKPPSVRPATRIDPVAPVGTEEEASYPGVSLPIAERETALGALRDQVSGCTLCDELSRCRTQTVFGEGSSAPRFAFFGEGPGQDEDRSGRPFVGRAGQLLTKMIEACTLRREDVYILNTVKCRPPGNRNPEGEELANCRSYYQQQLNLLRPEYIICLGAVSAQELLQSKLSVGRLRGKLHRYRDSKVLVTYHPAYLLRNVGAKKAAWQDLQLMMRDAGLM